MTASFACFVTGTDTEVGKTLISSAMLHALSVQGVLAAGMKPIASGVTIIDGQLQNEDVRALTAAANIELPLELVTPYLFTEPVAPHIGAVQNGISFDTDHILNCYQQIAQRSDAVIVEGVGGFRVPLTESLDTADLATQFALPIVLVVGMRLGCISHALLTAEAIAARGLTLAGWVANTVDPDMRYQSKNIAALKACLPAPLLGSVPRLSKMTAANAAQHLDFSPLPGWPDK